MSAKPVNIDVRIPWHEVTSTVLGAAIPYLAESGKPLPGAVIGVNVQSGAPFMANPWEYYQHHIVRSLDAVILGAKGAGKSMLAKSWATRLIRFGVKIAVPHDPNGEWGKVAEVVGGRVIRLGLGATERLNPLDIGQKPSDTTQEQWQHQQVQQRRAVIRSMIKILRGNNVLLDAEHTAIDLAVQEAMNTTRNTTIGAILQVLRNTASRAAIESQGAAESVGHTLRRVVHGDAAGLFDDESTVAFDNTADLISVDTSLMRHASMEAQALLRLATNNWIKNATAGGNRVQRVIVHEEAAIALLSEAADDGGLLDQVVQEKTSRHLGISNWYLLHRISDLDALGDQGSALQTRGLGLLADCDLRIIMAQQVDAMPRTQATLGLNDTHVKLIPKFDKGEGLWLIGEKRQALVKHLATEDEIAVFATDANAGVRSGV